MSDILARLRVVMGSTTKFYRNPDGPEAALVIEELHRKIERLENECYKKCGRCEFDYGSAAPKAAPYE